MATFISLPSLVKLGCVHHCNIGKGWSLTDISPGTMTYRGSPFGGPNNKGVFSLDLERVHFRSAPIVVA